MSLKIIKMFIYRYNLKYLYIFFISVNIISLFAPAAAAVQPGVLDNSCVDCHETLSPFTEEETRLNEIRVSHLEKNISCSLECHEDVIRRTAADNFHQWSESEHSRYFVTCDTCHGGDAKEETKERAHATIENPSDPNSSLYFKNIPEACGRCHTEELDHFKSTMHYQRLRGTTHGPSCITCHQPHHFKVLKASELTTLCSICHNLKDQVATATVPKDAKQALEKQEVFKEELFKARNAVEEARAAGVDVSSAQMDLDKATAVMDQVPSLWHGFDLKNFDNQIQNGIDWAKKAEYKVSGAEPTVPSTPGPEMLFISGIFAVLYLFRKK